MIGPIYIMIRHNLIPKDVFGQGTKRYDKACAIKDRIFDQLSCTRGLKKGEINMMMNVFSGAAVTLETELQMATHPHTSFQKQDFLDNMCRLKDCYDEMNQLAKYFALNNDDKLKKRLTFSYSRYMDLSKAIDNFENLYH